jgi:hypothetical protein
MSDISLPRDLWREIERRRDAAKLADCELYFAPDPAQYPADLRLVNLAMPNAINVDAATDVKAAAETAREMTMWIPAESYVLYTDERHWVFLKEPSWEEKAAIAKAAIATIAGLMRARVTGV